MQQHAFGDFSFSPTNLNWLSAMVGCRDKNAIWVANALVLSYLHTSSKQNEGLPFVSYFEDTGACSDINEALNCPGLRSASHDGTDYSMTFPLSQFFQVGE